jgi:hypothetical protein
MKIKLVHILTEIEEEREKKSIESLSPLGYMGLEYIQQINQRYTGDAWKEKKAISQSGYTNHGPGHYGAFHSFKKAIMENFSDDIDALVLCECDCVLLCDHQDFMNKLKESVEFSNLHNLYYTSLGSRYVNNYLQSPPIGNDSDPDYPDFYLTNKIILAHCVILPSASRDFYLECLEKYSWDSPDIWFNEVQWREGINKMGIIRDRLARQYEGVSLIDNVWKESQ